MQQYKDILLFLGSFWFLFFVTSLSYHFVTKVYIHIYFVSCQVTFFLLG